MTPSNTENPNWREDPLSKNLMEFLNEDAEETVRTYINEPKFTGSEFESFAGRGDREDNANTFTAEDIVAVSLLSIRIRGSAALAILEPPPVPEGELSLNDLLALIPNDRALWDDQAGVDADDCTSHAAELWRRLIKIPHVKNVTASKLLARKRPRLIPIDDKFVTDALRPSSEYFWIPLRNSLLANQSEVLHRLEEIRAAVGKDHDYSLLRILDAAVWLPLWQDDQNVKALAREAKKAAKKAR